MLLKIQERICVEKHQALVGSVQEVLVEGRSPKGQGRMQGRTVHHRIVHFEGDEECIGQYVPVRVREALAHSLVGDRLADSVGEQSEHDLRSVASAAAEDRE